MPKTRNFLESRNFWEWVGLSWAAWVGVGWGGLGLFENFKVYQSWVGNWVERFFNKIKDD